jgi:phage-related protein
MEKVRELFIFEHYFREFVNSLPQKVLFNGFQKKTQKTPQSEIDKALEIKKNYFKSKENGNKKQTLDIV